MGWIGVRPLLDDDRPWARRLMAERWGGEEMVVRGQLYRPAEHQGFVAALDGDRVGLLTYVIEGKEWEILSLDSLREGQGIGSALLEFVKTAARSTGCDRLRLITTNDNLDALRFYQKRGFALVAVHRDAVTAARALKPSIPLLGEHGIPIRDAIDLEFPLTP